MTDSRGPDYEAPPGSPPLDETDVSLRAYLAGLADAHLHEYDESWEHARVIEWDGNFRNDGCLMLVCCERNVGIEEFRTVLEEHLRLRGITSE